MQTGKQSEIKISSNL